MSEPQRNEAQPREAPGSEPRPVATSNREPRRGDDGLAKASELLPPARGTRYGWEIALVLGVSLGQSAIYSILSLIEKNTRPVPIGQQTTTMNNSIVPDRPWLDLSYQVAGIIFPMVPAFLALYLLWLTGNRREIGFDWRRPGFDVSRGFLAAAVIGIPGLAFYYAARALGWNTDVRPANLADNWWTIPVYVGLAVMNGVLEEVIMLGYLFTRLKQLGWRVWQIVAFSALIRGSYHLYQGIGGGIGNVVMGVVFGLLYLRWRRVGPLVVAHVLLDLVSFIGYALAAPYLPKF